MAEAISSPLLTLRAAIVLGLAALAEGLAAWWVLASSAPLPFAGTVPAAWLPQVLCGVAVAAAVFSAPFLAENKQPLSLARVFFSAFWQAAALGFFLLVSARLAPLEDLNLLSALAELALLAAALILLAALKPRLYPALAFLWLIGLPVLGYLLAEVYLWSAAGAAGEWQPQTAHGAYTCVHWLLNLSPGTAVLGSLTGSLADGAKPAGTMFLVFTGMLTALLSWRQAKAGKKAERNGQA
jgi:hypothetical protein